jgi:hypothetical protein
MYGNIMVHSVKPNAMNKLNIRANKIILKFVDD